MKNTVCFLFLSCQFFFVFPALIPLDNIIQFARQTLGKPISLQIEGELLQDATFENNQILVDEVKAAAIIDRYLVETGMQKPVRRQSELKKDTELQSERQRYLNIKSNMVSLASVMKNVSHIVGHHKALRDEIESKLLEEALIDQDGTVFINDTTATQIIKHMLAQPRRVPKILELIPLSGSLRYLPLVQLNVNQQKANSCGFHALYNLKAIEDLLANNQPITSQGVKEISRMYLDGYLAEMGMQESDVVDLAWEDRPAELSRAAGLKHFFLIQYFDPNTEFVLKGDTHPGARFAYNSDKDEFYFYDSQIKQAERDFVNSVQRNVFTPCILGVPGHYTAFAILHKPGQKPFIIYMNSISGDGVNSFPMQENSGESAVAEFLSNLIKNIP